MNLAPVRHARQDDFGLVSILVDHEEGVDRLFRFHFAFGRGENGMPLAVFIPLGAGTRMFPLAYPGFSSNFSSFI